jgi:hypothetical protein
VIEDPDPDSQDIRAVREHGDETDLTDEEIPFHDAPLSNRDRTGDVAHELVASTKSNITVDLIGRPREI